MCVCGCNHITSVSSSSLEIPLLGSSCLDKNGKIGVKKTGELGCACKKYYIQITLGKQNIIRHIAV